MIGDFIEFYYNKQKLRRDLDWNESKTEFVCPYDAKPILKRKEGKFEYICAACNIKYTFNELKELTKENLRKLEVKKNKLEKSLNKLNGK